MIDSGQPIVYYTDRARHLICVPYSIPNLHRMAEALNIKRCWYHAGRFPHYDIPKRRIAEIETQCTIIPSRELLRMIQFSLDQPRTEQCDAS